VEKEQFKNISVNKKARFNYTISDQYEAGLVLVGSEVKSLRKGLVNLKDSYAKITPGGEIFIYQMHIGAYPFAYYDNHDPLRPRKLLLHKSEIDKITTKISEKGYSLIPLSVYLKGSLIKLKMGIGKGKNLYDKRDTIKTREAQKELDRVNKYRDY
jgi:SsrA-binding protein